VSNLAPSLHRLIDAGFVVRHEDPIRSQRPLYALDDPFLQFHFAVLATNSALLRDRDPAATWKNRLVNTFNSQVSGPVFEQQARTWIRRFSFDATFAVRDHVGPSSVVIDGTTHELDVVVAGSGDTPSERVIHAIGEAKAGETIRPAHLRRLEVARSALGSRAADAKLVLFGTSFDAALPRDRSDVELVDLDRLYHGD
jgi:uncharacterized protein